MTSAHRHYFKTILFDLDGTLYVDGVPFGSVVDKLNRYLHDGKAHGIALTNNSSKGVADYDLLLRTIGLDLKRVSIMTPITVGARYLQLRELDTAYILGTAKCIADFERLGIRNDRSNPKCVIVAFDTELNYSKLKECCWHIHRGLPLFQTNIDKFCPTLHGNIPDCGAIQALLTLTTDRRPYIHFGKPGAPMVSEIRREYVHLSSKAVMVGDRLSTDIVLGHKLGITSVWVRTGDESPSESIRPDLEYNSMEEFIDEYS